MSLSSTVKIQDLGMIIELSFGNKRGGLVKDRKVPWYCEKIICLLPCKNLIAKCTSFVSCSNITGTAHRTILYV